MSPQKITVNTIISAPLERVWQAHTTSAEITQWNFASDDWCCPSAAVDLQVGGKYQARMEAKDASFGFDLEATYSEVEPNQALTMVMTDGRQARTTFEAIDAHRTQVSTIFDPEQQNSIAMQRAGWQAILDNFKDYLETNGQTQNATAGKT